MRISDFIAAADVICDAAFADKERLLDELGRRAGAAVAVPPPRIIAELRKREQLGSTGMGGGVAIPHARFAQLAKPFGMIVRLKRPIDFEAVDGERVDIVALLLLPDAPDSERLGALACLARALRDTKIVTALRHARDRGEIYRTLTAA
jgi:nitrogen PTS system EIIA component